MASGGDRDDQIGGGTVPEGVGQTAIGMAWVRAVESGRDDRLFDDPYAQAFVDAGADAVVTPTGDLARFVDMIISHGVMRTRFFDDYLRQAAADGHRQIVLLAAGLDTRAFRLAWPAGSRLFELDLPEMLAFKDRVLRARHAVAGCERITVPVDLAEPWRRPLLDAGFDPDQPTAWLAEGLLVYLTAAEADRLLTTVGDLGAAGSRLGFEYLTADTPLLEEMRTIPQFQRFIALFKGGLAEPSVSWLDRHGWQVRVEGRAELAARHGRPAPEPHLDGFLVAVRPGGDRGVRPTAARTGRQRRLAPQHTASDPGAQSR